MWDGVGVILFADVVRCGIGVGLAWDIVGCGMGCVGHCAVWGGVGRRMLCDVGWGVRVIVRNGMEWDVGYCGVWDEGFPEVGMYNVGCPMGGSWRGILRDVG